MQLSRLSLAGAALFTSTVALVSGCTDAFTADGKVGSEESAPIDGKFDSFFAPTEHGVLTPEVPASATISAAASFHSWSFTLSDRADVVAQTMTTVLEIANPPQLDTVLYLYKRGPNGWGSYIARNDDLTSNVLWSSITKTLAAGEYRLVVKGYSRQERGPFSLHLGCSGAGCKKQADSCLFGATFPETLTAGTVLNTGNRVITATDPLSGIEAFQIVMAVREASHPNVATAKEAIALVDGQTINKLSLWDPTGRRGYVAYEFRAGENSFGAIFTRDAQNQVAAIHDGDIAECTVAPQRCLLGPTYHDIQTTPNSFRILSQRLVKSGASLSNLAKQQIILAVHESIHTDVTTIAQAFEAADGGEINLVEFEERATKRRFSAVEFGAGDNSYGAIYDVGTVVIAAAIHDGDIDECVALVPLP